jgi:toxin ParE1/3/4
MAVTWSPRAQDHVQEIVTSLAHDDPEAADRMIDRIFAVTANLEAHPALGRPGRVSGTRELVISGTPYIVVYRARGDRVHVVAVWHSSRRWPRTL